MRLKQSWTRYAILTLLAWGFVPELRRLIDYKRGVFEPIEITSIIPLAMLVPLCVFAIFRGWGEASPKFRLFAAVWLVANGYALLIGLLSGSPILAALYEFVGFCAPVAFGIWVCAESARRTGIYRTIVGTLLAIGAVSSLYAVAQYISPFGWDAMWIYASGFTAAGPPLAFKMRAWGTMNSPGPFADYLVCTMLLALPLIRIRRPLALIAVLICAVGLAVTFVRADWASVVIGFCVYIVLSPKRRLAISGVSAVAALSCALFVTAPVLGGETGNTIIDHLTERFDTINTLDTDVSALTRQKEIDEGLDSSLQNPLGMGLGNVGTAAKLDGENANDIAVDSGYISRFETLGFLGFAGYLFVTVGSLWQAAAAAVTRDAEIDAERSSAIAATAAMFVGLFSIDFAVDAHSSFDGILFWSAMALAFTPRKSGVLHR